VASLYDVANGVSIREVIRDFAGVDTTRKRGNIPCPFHKDQKPSFSIYDNTNSFYCWSCKKSGTPINFLMELSGLTAEGAAKDIVDKYNLPYTESKPIDPAYKQYIDVYNYASEFYHAMNGHKESRAQNYWDKRKLTTLVDTYQLGYCPTVFIKNDTQTVVPFKSILKQKFPSIDDALLDSYGLYDKYGNSIMAGRFVIPIKDRRNNVVGFSGRSLNPNEPKYLNTSENAFFKKRYLLFNGYEGLKYPHVYVVEGMLDALSLVVMGIPNVVSTMGTSFTKDHFDILSDKHVILCFDQDTAGKEAMLELVERYPQKLFDVYIPKFKEKDFNDALMAGLDFSDVKVHNAIYGTEFMIRYLKETLDLSNLKAREEIYDRVNRSAKHHSVVARDYFSTILKRLIKGKRV
jgi:DNA primase